jgi:hypothetical protein
LIMGYSAVECTIGAVKCSKVTQSSISVRRSTAQHSTVE